MEMMPAGVDPIAVPLARRFAVIRSLSTRALAFGATLTLGVLALGSAAHADDQQHGGPATLPGKTIVTAPPAGTSGPDDLTRLAVDGLDGGKALLWVPMQNGIGPDGTPGTVGGPTKSDVVGFDPSTGTPEDDIKVLGKVDGLTALARYGLLLATVNEDANSRFVVIDPETDSVVTYTYSPDPGASSGGGTDSITLKDGHIYVSHSNPSALTEATMYEVTLDGATHVAKLRAVFFDDSPATGAAGGTLALTDPDTNYTMPRSSPRFAGQVATISQGDGVIVFAADPAHHPKLTELALSDNVAKNLPPIDGLAVATSDEGTLYVVDAKAQIIEALNTDGWPPGTAFVTEASDNANPLLGVLDLRTGQITPLGNVFQNPKGILFVPKQDGQNQDGQGQDQGS
jgi:hypothetical protein